MDPLEKMLQDKQTVAGEILAEVKKLGYKDMDKDLPKDIAAQILFNHSQCLFQEIILAGGVPVSV